MKRLNVGPSLWGMLFWAVAVILLAPLSLLGQKLNVNPEGALPKDPAVRTGVLPNGLTYYIRENHEPKNRAELRLAVNTGSVLEDEDQLGLAHFVEHMAFNGSTHFNKSALVDYLESIGTKFGAHLNAYTSFDETVYMLQVPTDQAEIMDKAFLVLEDWAHGVSFENGEIDKERGVVIEEWRLGLGADARMRDRYFPVLFNGSQYANRLPIGKKEILENFKYETVKRFYKDWYRPDLMAVIAVGDFDGAAMEARIKGQFSKIPAAVNPRKRTFFQVPDHAEPLASVETDKEATMTMAQLIFKHPNASFVTEADYRSKLVGDMASLMLTKRLEELKMKANSPIVFGGAFEGNLIRTQSAFATIGVMKPGEVQKGLEWMMTEVERVRRHGFTAPELERARKEMLRQMEKMYSEKDKTESRSLTQEYLNHFLQGVPFPGLEMEKGFYEKYIPSISLEEVSQRIQSWITDKNLVILVAGPEKEGLSYPTPAQVIETYKKIRATEVQPYTETVDDSPLVAKTPKTGTIVAEKKLDAIGVTEWTLSNGVKVILKQTDFKNDQILLHAFSKGGTNRFSDKDFPSASQAADLAGLSGLSKFSQPVLEKKLAGKVVSVSPYFTELFEGVRGECAPADLETFLQLVYLTFTAPRQDPEAFDAYKSQLKTMVAMKAGPEQVFQDSVNSILHNRHWRYRPITNEDIDKLDLNKAFLGYMDRFSDASDFTFVMVGNFDPNHLKPLAEQWLGSLPSLNRKEAIKDLGVRPPAGVVKSEIHKGTEPKSMVRMSFHGDFVWSGQNNFDARAMMRVLSIMLRESMREDKGGVYGVGANVTTFQFPTPGYRIDIMFGCSPDNVETLIETAMKDIKTLQESGASEKNLQKVKETYRRERETDLRTNEWWLARLQNAYQNGDDPNGILELEKALDGLSAESVKASALKYFQMGHYTQIVLKPEN